jgi:hypothetical protein
LQEATNAYTTAQTRVEERERDVPIDLRDLNALNRAREDAANVLRFLNEALTAARKDADQANEKLTASKSSLDELTRSAISAQDRAQEYDRQFQESIQAAGFVNEDADRNVSSV